MQSLVKWLKNSSVNGVFLLLSVTVYLANLFVFCQEPNMVSGMGIFFAGIAVLKFLSDYNKPRQED